MGQAVKYRAHHLKYLLVLAASRCWSAGPAFLKLLRSAAERRQQLPLKVEACWLLLLEGGGAAHLVVGSCEEKTRPLCCWSVEEQMRQLLAARMLQI